jgi:uncharacterized protein YuzE
MQIEYFQDSDTLQITFREGRVVDTFDVGEDALAELDAEGRLVTLTVEHAGQQGRLLGTTPGREP